MLCFGYAQAQNAVNTSGGNAAGVNGSVSYSIGQVVYTTNTSIAGSVAQGVQHAYEIFPVGGSNIHSVTASVQPNPTADILVLQLDNYQQGNFNYTLHDAQGKLVLNGNIQSKKTIIETQQLPSAVYFLSVINDRKEKIETFKIIKNQ
jgi:hypothetical protein